MRTKFLSLILTFILFVGYASAQEISCGKEVPESQMAFKEGEVLRYGATYSAAFINMSVADIVFTTTRQEYSMQDCYRVNAVAKTKSFFNFFFKMEDTYDTWLNASTLRPLKATSYIKEGGYRFRSSIDYSWFDKTVYTEGKNLKSDYWSRRTMKIEDCSADALAMFYNLRSADVTNMREGDSKNLSLVFEDTIHNIRLKYLGKEVIKVKSMGSKVSTMKFTCQLATSDGESFNDGDEFLIWLSDDRNRIPVYMESPIRVGKVFGRIESWENLRYPLDCVLEE